MVWLIIGNFFLPLNNRLVLILIACCILTFVYGRKFAQTIVLMKAIIKEQQELGIEGGLAIYVRYFLIMQKFAYISAGMWIVVIIDVALFTGIGQFFAKINAFRLFIGIALSLL